MESGCVTFFATTALELVRTFLLRRPEGQGPDLFDTMQEGLWFRSSGSLIPAFCVGMNKQASGGDRHWDTEERRMKEGADGRQLYDQVVI